MKITNKDILVLVILIFLVLFNQYGTLGFTIASLLTVILFLDTTKDTLGIYFLLFFFNIFGLWGEKFGIPKAGLLIFVIALILLKMQGHFQYNLYRCTTYIFPFFLFFLIAYAYGPMHSYSDEKIIFILYKGLFYLLGFYVLIVSPQIDYYKVSLLLLLGVYQYYCHFVSVTDWMGPINILDMGSLRNYYSTTFRGDQEREIINYQEMGLLCVFSINLGFNSLLNTYNKKNIFIIALTILIGFALLLFSGSRQSLYSIPILLGFYTLINNNLSIRKKFKLFLLAFPFITGLYFYIYNTSDSVYRTSDGNNFTEKINRPEEIMHAVSLISEKPLFGHGLGGFSKDYLSPRYYPHNILLEIISEAGFIGLSILAIICIIYLRRFKFSSRTASRIFLFPFFLIYFIRANLSSDLIETVYIFSFLAVYFMFYKLQVKKGNENISYNI